MSKKRQAGFDFAKEQYESGVSIERLVIQARNLPPSQFTIGFLTYVTDQQIEEMRKSKVKP